jgi:DNA-binding SARP family transcriptional activator
MDLFWSSGGKKGQHSLHNSITQIRKTLDDPRRELLQRKLDGYTLAPDCWVDTEEFLRVFTLGRNLAREGRWDHAMPLLHEAEGLAAQEFLPGQRAEWTHAPRAWLAEQTAECRTLLADYFSERGKHVVAVELWKRVLSHDNCHEAAYRGLLESYRALGRPAEAVRVYQACVKAFEEELELPPPPDLAALLDF